MGTPDFSLLEIDAGAFRQRVAWKRPVPPSSHHDSNAPTDATLATLWASVRPLTGQELLLARQQQSIVTHQVYLRAGDCAGLAPADHLLWQGRTLEIKDRQFVDGRSAYVRCDCTERA